MRKAYIRVVVMTAGIGLVGPLGCAPDKASDGAGNWGSGERGRTTDCVGSEPYLIGSAGSTLYPVLRTASDEGSVMVVWEESLPDQDAQGPVWARQVPAGAPPNEEARVVWSGGGSARAIAGIVQLARVPEGYVAFWNQQGSGGKYDIYVNSVQLTPLGQPVSTKALTSAPSKWLGVSDIGGKQGDGWIATWPPPHDNRAPFQLQSLQPGEQELLQGELPPPSRLDPHSLRLSWSDDQLVAVYEREGVPGTYFERLPKGDRRISGLGQRVSSHGSDLRVRQDEDHFAIFGESQPDAGNPSTQIAVLILGKDGRPVADVLLAQSHLAEDLLFPLDLVFEDGWITAYWTRRLQRADGDSSLELYAARLYATDGTEARPPTRLFELPQNAEAYPHGTSVPPSSPAHLQQVGTSLAVVYGVNFFDHESTRTPAGTDIYVKWICLEDE